MSIEDRAPETPANSATDPSVPAELAALKRRLDSQEERFTALLRDQADRLAEQERELRTLRAVAAQTLAEEARQATPVADRELLLPQPVAQSRASRRTAIARAAAAFATLGLAGAAGAGRAQAQTPTPGAKSAGASGDPLQVGLVRTGGNNTELTGIQNAATAATNILFVASQNFGFANITANVDTTKFNVALLGQNVLNGVNSKQSVGVFGQSVHGTGVFADGLWPLVIDPSAAGAALPDQDNAPTPNTVPSGTLFYHRGAFHPPSGIGIGTYDPDTLWLNFAPTSAISLPGSTYWRRVAYQGSAGVFVPITPVRVLNSGFAVAAPIGFDQTGAALATAFQMNVAPNTDETRQFRLAGKFGLPADITGVFGNVTVVQSVSSGGFVSVFAGGATAPTVSTVNPSTPIQANSFFSQVSSTGNISVRAVGDQAKYLIIDIFGYYF